MRLYLRLAWRNLWRHRRRTLIVMLSIALVMAMMMLYDGLVAGFEQAIYGNAVQVLGGNIQIHAAGYSEAAGQNPLTPLPDAQAAVKAAEAQPQVIAATQRIITGGMASSHEGAFAVSITGIQPEKEKPVSLEAQHVSAGRYLTSQDQDMVYIGKGLADAAGVGVGDRITLVGRGLHDQMKQHTLTVAGIYDIGMPDLEKANVFISLGEAQYLYNLDGQATEIAVTLKQLGPEKAVISALEPALPGYDITSWETSFPEMQSALNAKGGVMNIFSVIILVIAGIGILNLLLMAVFERTREIGLMGALGMKPRQISWLFLLEGCMMGLVGLAAGVALGLGVNLILGKVGIDYSQFTSMTSYTALITGRVYSSLGVEKLAQRGVTVLIISLLASFIPAREASEKEPAEALHFV